MINTQDSVIKRIDFENKDIFEIGCGCGDFTCKYLSKAKSILGIDTDKDKIECLAKKWPTGQKDGHFTFQVGDIIDFSPMDQAFDIVIFSRSF